MASKERKKRSRKEKEEGKNPRSPLSDSRLGRKTGRARVALTSRKGDLLCRKKQGKKLLPCFCQRMVSRDLRERRIVMDFGETLLSGAQKIKKRSLFHRRKKKPTGKREGGRPLPIPKK